MYSVMRFVTNYLLLNLLFESVHERCEARSERKLHENKLFGFRDNWNSGSSFHDSINFDGKICSYKSTTADFRVLLSLAPVLHQTVEFETVRNQNLYLGWLHHARGSFEIPFSCGILMLTTKNM